MRYNEYIISGKHGNPIIKTFRSSVPEGPRPLREHHHTECELSVVICGAGIYRSGSKSYEFSSGDMFLFGSNEAHCITDVHTPLTLLNVHFEPRLLWESEENLEILRLFAPRDDERVNMICSSDTVLREMIMHIERELCDSTVGYSVIAKSELLSALVHIMRSRDSIGDALLPHNSVALTKRLEDAISYIDKNLDRHLSLEDIAERACMAPTYFSAVFKRFGGISPWDYIMIKRVERAVEMLKSTDMTKIEIAEACGFSSSSNFYKVFFKITGKRPSDYSRK